MKTNEMPQEFQKAGAGSWKASLMDELTRIDEFAKPYNRRDCVVKDKLRIGIIGCGGIAKAHVEGYLKNGLEITALTDVNASAAAAMAEKCKSAKCFKDCKALLDSGKVDAVSICTPPAAHEEAAVMALGKNIHVLLEKPQAHTLKSAENIANAAKKSKGLLMMAYRHRFLPAVQMIKTLIDADRIGNPVLFNNIFCGPASHLKDKWFTKKEIAGGGCMLDTSSHSVDLFRYLMGEVIAQEAVMHRHWEETNVEDASLLTVKSERGAIGSLGAAWVAGSGAAFIDVFGLKGRLYYDYCKPDELKYFPPGGEPESLKVEPSNGFAEQIAHFVAAIDGREELSCTAFDGLRTMQIILSSQIESTGERPVLRRRERLAHGNRHRG